MMTFFGVALLCTSGAQAARHPPAGANIASQKPVDSEEKSALIKRGEYVVILGDCIGCHTAPREKRMSGGLMLMTPMGPLYSANITPDITTGIGQYTFEEFDRALRKGVADDGRNLYPAMPYPSFARITEEDMRALYAYLTQGVAPINRPNKPAALSWPFSMRWGVALWNWAFLDSSPFKPDATRDVLWNRGAYLVQGLGHCGACHTPRGIAFQEKAMNHEGSDGKLYLAGETIEAWRALSLRDLWTVQDAVVLLKTGQNRFGSTSSRMIEVIHHSTQHFSDADLAAVATYLKSLPTGKSELPMPAAPVEVPPSKSSAKLFYTPGGIGYVQFCVNCHRLNGGGVKGIFPSLVQNPSLASSDPATLLHVTLTGWKTAQTKAYPRVYTMPGFSRLSDQELAEILSFVRESWGNNAGPIKASQVKEYRAELRPSDTGPSNFETPRLANMLKEPNAEQLVRGMRLHLETGALLPRNVGDALNCTSCHLSAGTVADGSPFVGVAAFFPGYAPRAGRIITLEDRINGCFLRSMHGKPLAMESPDMKAMVAYFDWMKGKIRIGDKVVGRGVGKIDRAIKPHVKNGRKVYLKQCAVCHGKDGEGLRQADGRYLYPPLWGKNSFNIGAGMARTYTAAAFVKGNMPIGSHEKFPLGQGGLSGQEAVDVAAYFTHQPRPDFPAKVKDWPRDKKPQDARY